MACGRCGQRQAQIQSRLAATAKVTPRPVSAAADAPVRNPSTTKTSLMQRILGNKKEG